MTECKIEKSRAGLLLKMVQPFMMRDKVLKRNKAEVQKLKRSSIASWKMKASKRTISGAALGGYLQTDNNRNVAV